MNVNTSGNLNSYASTNRPAAEAGPDEVYDEFDNGRADHGPDAIVDDSRSSYSGDSSYDSYSSGGSSDYIGGFFIG